MKDNDGRGQIIFLGVISFVCISREETDNYTGIYICTDFWLNVRLHYKEKCLKKMSYEKDTWIGLINLLHVYKILLSGLHTRSCFTKPI